MNHERGLRAFEGEGCTIDEIMDRHTSARSHGDLQGGGNRFCVRDIHAQEEALVHTVKLKPSMTVFIGVYKRYDANCCPQLRISVGQSRPKDCGPNNWQKNQ